MALVNLSHEVKPGDRLLAMVRDAGFEQLWVKRVVKRVDGRVNCDRKQVRPVELKSMEGGQIRRSARKSERARAREGRVETGPAKMPESWRKPDRQEWAAMTTTDSGRAISDG